MAKSILNVVMQGASGKIGKTLVFRQTKNGDTVIANRAKPRTTPPTPDEEAVREKFQDAAYIAKILAKDPIYGPQYLEKAKKLGKTAYIIAMQDCLTAPKIKAVNVYGYNGAIGNAIVVRAIEDFKVASVRVRILKSDNTVIEQGYAIVEDNNLDWVYVATVQNTDLSGSKVEVTASDIPGNETVKTVTMN